jgi:DNA-binding transcriptional LysR family regulator
VLTEPGMDLLEHVRAMGDAASRVSLAASGQSQALEGTVTITVGEMFAAYVLPPILSKLRAREPGIDIEIVASNTPSDLRRREADIAIRNFRPTDPELVARKVRDMAGHLYAATSYLDRLGRPITLAKLNQADFVGFARTPALIDRLRPLGLELSQKNFVLISENQLVQWALIKRGLGLGVMSEVIGDNEPLVERALPEIEAVMFPVWLASHRELHTSRRVRVVFDLLADELARV